MSRTWSGGLATKMKKESGTPPPIVLMDVPRCSHLYVNYQVMEACKNGMLFCGKYESGQLCFPSPHVYVFMNYDPDYEKLSKDRYIIRRIRDDPEWKSIPVHVPQEVEPPVFGDDGDLDDDALFAYLNME